MSVDTDFYSWLTNEVANPVEQNKADETLSQPRIVFTRRDSNTERFLHGEVIWTTTRFDVEVSGLSIDSVVTAGNTLRNALDAYQGMMGSTTIYLALVEDVSDDYTPKTMFNDDAGFHVYAFSANLRHS